MISFRFSMPFYQSYKCRKTFHSIQPIKYRNSSLDIGGFHLHLLVFPFVYQFNSRVGVLVNSSFANDKFRRISTTFRNMFVVYWSIPFCLPYLALSFSFLWSFFIRFLDLVCSSTRVVMLLLLLSLVGFIYPFWYSRLSTSSILG